MSNIRPRWDLSTYKGMNIMPSKKLNINENINMMQQVGQLPYNNTYNTSGAIIASNNNINNFKGELQYSQSNYTGIVINN